MKKKFVIAAMIIILFAALLAISKSNIFVETNSCVGCGDCIDVCPIPNAIQLIDGRAVINAELCIDCEICIKSCTYEAIRNNK